MKIYLLLCSLLSVLSASSQTGKWQLKYAPYFRQVNGVQMLGNNSFVTVGGNPVNDSIRTISLSIDGGMNMNLIMDSVNSAWLKSVHFVDASIGYAVGDDGGLLKTTDGGVNWNGINLTGNAAGRSYNSVFFIDASTGFIAGGNQSNDSIQTILKTTDGGISWVPQRDVPGPWLKDVCFINANTGFAVGEKGVLLKTTNGGGQWSAILLTGNAAQRTYNSIAFADANTGIMVGGNRQNDSIQTILRTTDGGNTWTIVSDSVAPWLNAVQFYDNNNGHAVGDDGTLLKTTDKGLTWSGINLPDTVNDFRHLYTIHFINQYFGIASGQDGKLLLYNTDSLPPILLQTTGVKAINPKRVILSGTANNNNAPGSLQVSFQYSTSLQFNDSVIANPASVSGSQPVAVSATVDDLAADTWYYYRLRAVNGYGLHYSNVDSFKSTLNLDAIANWDFELWDTVVTERPTTWFTRGDIQKVPSFDGGNAIQLRTAQHGTRLDGSVLINGLMEGGQPIGGVPFTDRPDSIKAYFKYDLEPGDSGIVIVIMKKAGTVIAENMYFYTGSSGGNFVPLSFPITYQSGSNPDSLLLGFSNSNVFDDTPGVSSVVVIDKISFPGSAQNVSDSDFEDWTSYTLENATDWNSDNAPYVGGGFKHCVKKTVDSYSGNFAIEMQNDPHYEPRGYSLMSRAYSDILAPAFALNFRPRSINGYFKYFPDEADSMAIDLILYYQGVEVGIARFECSDSVTQYTPFSASVTYAGFLGTPDSAFLRISPVFFGNSQSHGYTKLVLDAVSFDGLIDSTYVDTIEIIIGTEHVIKGALTLYPNPANNVIHLQYSALSEKDAEVSIFNIQGSLLHRLTVNVNHSYPIDISQFPAGLYLVNVKTGDINVTHKFLRSN